MTRSITALALGLTLAACAPSTHATAFRQAEPKTSPDEVSVYTDSRPERAYEEIGTIEVSASELSNSRYGDLIERARRKAAEMGADAIIVTRDPTTRNTGLAYVPPSSRKHGQVVTGTSRTVETPRIQVAVIVWKA